MGANYRRPSPAVYLLPGVLNKSQVWIQRRYSVRYKVPPSGINPRRLYEIQANQADVAREVRQVGLVKFRNRIMNIEPRAALTATSKAVARATGNGIPLSASAAPFFSSA